MRTYFRWLRRTLRAHRIPGAPWLSAGGVKMLAIHMREASGK